MQLRSHPQEDYHRSIIHIDQVQVQQTPFYKPPCSHTHIKPMLLVTTYYQQARETQILDRPKHNTTWLFFHLSTNCYKIMCRVMRGLLYSQLQLHHIMKLHYALRTGPPGRPFIRSCTSASDLPVGTLDLDDDLHLSSCNHHQPRPKSTSKPDLYVHSKTSAAIFRIHAPRFRMLLFYSKIQQNRHKIASEK